MLIAKFNLPLWKQENTLSNTFFEPNEHEYSPGSDFVQGPKWCFTRFFGLSWKIWTIWSNSAKNTDARTVFLRKKTSFLLATRQKAQQTRVGSKVQPTLVNTKKNTFEHFFESNEPWNIHLGPFLSKVFFWTSVKKVALTNRLKANRKKIDKYKKIFWKFKKNSSKSKKKKWNQHLKGTLDKNFGQNTLYSRSSFWKWVLVYLQNIL